MPAHIHGRGRVSISCELRFQMKHFANQQEQARHLPIQIQVPVRLWRDARGAHPTRAGTGPKLPAGQLPAAASCQHASWSKAFQQKSNVARNGSIFLGFDTGLRTDRPLVPDLTAREKRV